MAPEHDPVSNPAHYNFGDIEVIDYMQQVAGQYEAVEAPLVGNVIKYVSRAPIKASKIEDLKKARWYLDRLIGQLEETEAKAEEAECGCPFCTSTLELVIPLKDLEELLNV